MTSVLLVRLGALGDVIHAIPAAAALRAAFPSARIDWLVDPRYVSLLGMVAGLDRAIPIDPRDLFDGATRSGFRATMRDLRRARYDAVLDLQGLLKSAVLSRAVGARRTIGFPKAHLREPLARLLYTDTADPGGAVHVIQKNLALLEAVGVRDRTVRFPLDVPTSSVADAVAARHGDGYALINPGAAWPNKRWPADRFGALAASIHARAGLRSVVLWGPGEQPLAQAVVDTSGGAAELSPPTAIADLFALARRARLIVSGDTGPLHIAAAVGTPVVALFGPTWFERNGPWAPDDISLTRAAQCVCHYERCCRTGRPCIEDIGLPEVEAAVWRRLALAGGRV